MPTTDAPVTHRRCRCAGCGEVFSAVSVFDKHRKGDYAKGRHCVDPASVGLELKIGPNGSWWGETGDFRPRKGETLSTYRIAGKTRLTARHSG